MSAPSSAFGLKRRFKVGYALLCGNTFDARHGNGEVAEAFYGLSFAQAFAELIRVEHKLKNQTSCVFITDLDNEEAGDLTSVDPEEYGSY